MTKLRPISKEALEIIDPRVWSKVLKKIPDNAPENECWFGPIGIMLRDRSQLSFRRVVYALFVGPLSPQEELKMSCSTGHTPRFQKQQCVNYNHCTKMESHDYRVQRPLKKVVA